MLFPSRKCVWPCWVNSGFQKRTIFRPGVNVIYLLRGRRIPSQHLLFLLLAYFSIQPEERNWRLCFQTFGNGRVQNWMLFMEEEKCAYVEEVCQNTRSSHNCNMYMFCISFNRMYMTEEHKDLLRVREQKKRVGKDLYRNQNCCFN